MKKTIIILSLIFMGCTPTTTINWHDGKEIKIKGASDELITAKIGTDEVVSDRRGQPNVFQSLINLLMLKGMGTEVK